MFAEKSDNEYGSYMYRPVIGETSRRNIVFIHDFLTDPQWHDDFCDKLEIFNYYGIYLPYAKRKEYDEDVPLEKTTFISMIKYAKDLILSFPGDEFYLIGEGLSAPIALALATLLSKKVKKLVVVNPYTSMASANTITTINNLPQNLDEAYDLFCKMLDKNSRYLKAGSNSEIVVNAMRKIYYNYEDYVEFVLNMSMPKTLESIKVYERNIRIPTMLIVGDCDDFIVPVESILAYKNNASIKIVQLPKSKHFPIMDENKKIYIESILKFFVDGLNIVDEKRLPSKYVYSLLSDDWKRYYRTTFAEKLNEREQKEYLEKLAEYEKQNKTDIEIPTAWSSEEEKNSFVNQQALAVKQMQDYVSYNHQQQLNNEKNAKLSMIPDVYIDYSITPNKIVINSQGFEVYHDGRGNGFFKDYNGTWKKIIDKSNI